MGDARIGGGYSAVIAGPCSVESEEQIIEVKETVEGVFANLEQIDTIISSFSEKRNLSRMPKINLAILRLAVYEILYKSDIAPIKVVINEAVGLAKKYALDPDISFVNGVLGAYSRSLEN